MSANDTRPRCVSYRSRKGPGKCLVEPVLRPAAKSLPPDDLSCRRESARRLGFPRRFRGPKELGMAKCASAPTPRRRGCGPRCDQSTQRGGGPQRCAHPTSAGRRGARRRSWPGRDSVRVAMERSRNDGLYEETTELPRLERRLSAPQPSHTLTVVATSSWALPRRLHAAAAALRTRSRRTGARTADPTTAASARGLDGPHGRSAQQRGTVRGSNRGTSDRTR